MKIKKIGITTAWIAAILMTLAIGLVHAQAEPASVTAPEVFNMDLTPSSTFFINITVNNAEKLWGVQFTLSWDPTILMATSVTGIDPFLLQWPTDIYPDHLTTAWSLPLANREGVNIYEPTPVVTVGFTVQEGGWGGSPLDLQETILSPATGGVIPHTVTDGYFLNVEVIGEVDLIKKAAWVEHVTWVITRDPEMTLTAKIKSFANVATVTKVVFILYVPGVPWAGTYEVRAVLGAGQVMDLTTTIAFASLAPGYATYDGTAQAFFKDATGNWIAGQTIKKFHFNAQQPGQQP